MMQRIDELTSPPKIGRFYLVPTVDYIWLEVADRWPIIGPKHSDKQIIDFPYQHYHVDGRFLSPKQVRRVYSREKSLEFTLAVYPLCQYRRNRVHIADFDVFPHPEPVWRRRKCQRHLEYPTWASHWQVPLEEAYKSYSLIDGICPHRGAYIGNMVPDHHGAITCPLHGLRWDLKTGEMCRRYSQPAGF